MENSRKSSSADWLAAQLAHQLPRHGSILVGLSGGVDSVVLLHLLCRLAPRHDWQISALHVHHGLSIHADSWAAFCRRLCTQLAVPLQVERVDTAPLREQGVEAAARKLRYRAFSAQDCDFIALAHHADDQAETLLLQLLRGAGVRGASAMPVLSKQTARPQIVRPLLNCSRQAILDYADAHRLAWVEDESNDDDRYPRNFLRHQVLPLLAQRFPAYRETLTRGARHFAEAATLLDELAQRDAECAIFGATLDVAALRGLDQARAKNLLRYFMAGAGAPMPALVKLDEGLRQLLSARDDAAVCVVFGGWQLRRYQNRAHLMPSLPDWDASLAVSWQGEETLAWSPLRRCVQFLIADGAGISLGRLRRAPVTLRLRRGGESIRPGRNSRLRTLKNLLQEQRIPPWQRARLPLLFCGDELVCVPGVVIAAEYQASVSEPGVQISLGDCNSVHSIARIQ